ncbi:nuclear transport factor 2 family protein [Streptomyces sp. NPDC046860]|uniref:nuclear transport factor 2 family protein n=1 Tax=Streptomyces sp. NPDC046860 TaxID=3154495 RepID=UPI0033E1AC88
MAENLTLEQRVQRLEDIEEIKKLTATYSDYVNKGWIGKEVAFDKLPSVFTSDAVWESAAMGVKAEGIDAIVAMLGEATAGGSFAMHSFTNPIIDVDGDSATGNWLLWVAVAGGGKPNEVHQSEDLRYVRTPDGWRIQDLNLHFGQLLLTP